MKKILVVLALVGMTMAASSALAFGDCDGKDHKPIKKITQSTPTGKTSG